MAGGRWSRSYEQRYQAARARGEPSPFDDPAPPAVPGPPVPAAPDPPLTEPERPGGRHCWVAGPPSSPGPHPGLLLAWRRERQGWWGRVAYVVLDPDSRPVLIDTWVPADTLRPSPAP